jgi:hypothetical protein
MERLGANTRISAARRYSRSAARGGSRYLPAIALAEKVRVEAAGEILD